MSWPQLAQVFQSTLPRRERRAVYLATPRVAVDFNPRSREGSDTYGLKETGKLRNFNPRSREGSD